MRAIYWDTETHLIKKGNITPRLVCVSWAERETPEGILGWNLPESTLTFADEVALEGLTASRDGISRGLLDRDDGIEWVRHHLEDDGVTLIGDNVAYDFGVVIASAPREEYTRLMRLVFEKYEKGLVHDTDTRQKLIDIATGEMKFHNDEDTGEPVKTRYALAELARRLLKKFLKKKDTWRLRYAELDGVPLAEWPEEAIRYAIDDAVTTLEVHEKQDEIAGGPIPDSDRQHRAAWGLHLMSAWGIRTDGIMVAKLKAELAAEFAGMMNKLRPSGLLKIRPARVPTRGKLKGTTVPEKITKFMKAIQERVVSAYASAGEKVIMTEPSEKFPYGQVSTAKKTLLEAAKFLINRGKETGDAALVLSGEELVTLAEAGKIGKLLQTYIPVLESGTVTPINARYNGLVETGRTSCARPNWQNPPRAGGIRECVIPRDGWVYTFCDYDTLELRSLAQCCLDMVGRSDMAEALRRGEDLHLSFAAEKLGIPYPEALARMNSGDNAIAEERQFCKISNFGFPGGLGANAFVEYAAGYGTAITLAKAHELKDNWFNRWSEMRDYFAIVTAMSETGNPIAQLQSGRIRGGASFCAIANGFFQGRAADGAKCALWAVAQEAYTVEESPLFECRPVLFIHDEIGTEVPYRWRGAVRSSAAAERQAEIMVRVMKEWLPDVPVSATPIMCRRWFKGVKPVKVNGVLVPSKPVKEGKKTLWVADLNERDAA